MERRETAARIYDERFCRMWEFYLAGSETSFRNEGMVVFQMQIAKSLQSLPLSREYMVDEERRLNAGAEQPQHRLLAGD